MNKLGWLLCESVQPGMFSDERAVVVTRSNGATESYFVPAGDVRSDRVRVELRETAGLMWATLPTSEPVVLPVNKAKVEIQ